MVTVTAHTEETVTVRTEACPECGCEAAPLTIDRDEFERWEDGGRALFDSLTPAQQNQFTNGLHPACRQTLPVDDRRRI